ncbi:AAA family ATPase [Bacteriovorax sp. PP10]|uniref:DNA repair protein RecN n=1 Tax=Bacteriovorax antarcticus TaxID=3088717 RepID=A0ABU5VNT7_9BACT|nr:AAA family ATPase [Bacteriovorax sp. PP10]MEA9354703.1 AAA family ATPase [Bacteriovorax sp. PP10]
MKTNETLYLKSLNLQNFATFENQIIQFDIKFNTIVGETGSGKSLILDALQIIFGGRADKKLIRKNAEFATIEAVFSSNDPVIKKYFHDIGHPFDGDEIVVKRNIFTNESSKSYLNFQSCSASLLAAFAKRFVDLVGQFENQKLLSEDYQLVLLDSYAGLSQDIHDYQALYTQLSNFKKDFSDLMNEKSLRAQREDYIRFQLEELEKLTPSIDDEAELSKKKDLILNVEKRQQTLGALASAISDDETNLLDLLKACLNKAEKSGGIVSEEITAKLYEVKALLEDVSYDLSKDLNATPEDENIEEIIDRLDTYQRLKRKFGGSTEEMIRMFAEFRAELDSFFQVDDKIALISKKISDLENRCQSFAEELHNIRIARAESLSKELTVKVRDLKMNGATLKINVTKNDHLGSKGFSKIDFIAETNPGEGFFKVKDIASGGELSRILLSVRQILSSNDTISVFLFDEIDTGIGGETALSIGKSLQSVAEYSQVLAITHLPQIASFATQIINVSKTTKVIDDQPRTVSIIEQAMGAQRESFIKAMNPEIQ